MTFAGAVLHYPAKPREAVYLQPIVRRIGNTAVKSLTGQFIKALAREMLPDAAVDTWQRQVVTPTRAVINNAHELGLCPYLKVKAFTRNERIEQDRKRGRASRQKKVPGSWDWLDAFRAEALSRRNPYQAALAHFMFVSGARITQSVTIEPRDLDLQRSRVRIPAAKGHEAQWVQITTALVVELANLPPRNGRIFGYLSRHGVYTAWHSICEAAGIETIMPHAAGRHGFGTEMLVRQGLDPATVAEAGRWASPRVLLETYSHAENAGEKILEALEKGRVRTNPVQGRSPAGANLLAKKGKS